MAAGSNGHDHQPQDQRAEQLDEQARRRSQVAVLIASHVTYREIARRLEVAVGTVANDVKAIRQEWRDHASEQYGEMLATETAKLNIIEERLLPRVLAGGKDAKMDLFALDRWFVLQERRARLLGLDAPQRIEVTMRLEKVAKAIEYVVVMLGMDPDEVRPLLGAKLRELDAVTEG